MSRVRTTVRQRLIVLSAAIALASALGGCVWTDWDHDDWHHHGEHWNGYRGGDGYQPYYQGGRWYHGRYWERWDHDR